MLRATYILLVIVAGTLCVPVFLRAAEERGKVEESDLVLLSTVSAEEYRLGEPVFVTLKLKNVSNAEQDLRIPLPIGRSIWSMELGRGEAPLERVDFTLASHEVWAVRTAPLAPGESFSDVVALWFRQVAVEGDPPRVYQLLFEEPGTYRYRITMLVPRGAVEEFTVSYAVAEGTINVGEPADGLDRMLEGLKGRMQWRLGLPEVYFTHSRELEQLAGEVAGTPYASYVKWLRVRASVEQGREGWRVLEDGGPAAAREMATLQDYSDDLLAGYAGSGLPPERAALIARGLVHVVRQSTLVKLLQYGMAALGEAGLDHRLNDRELQAMGYTGTLESLSAAQARALAEQEGRLGSAILQELEERWPHSIAVGELKAWAKGAARELARTAR